MIFPNNNYYIFNFNYILHINTTYKNSFVIIIKTYKYRLT